MVAPLQSNYTNRKGIYKDLYREINADNNKKRPRKGIYVNLYKQFEQEVVGFKETKTKQERENIWRKYFSTLSFFASRIGYLFTRIRLPVIG